jgi:hypothetical protein
MAELGTTEGVEMDVEPGSEGQLARGKLPAVGPSSARLVARGNLVEELAGAPESVRGDRRLDVVEGAPQRASRRAGGRRWFLSR